MNERIRQLTEQAQKVAYYTDGGYTPIMTLDQEKFAELIVRECADVVKYYYIRGGEPITPQHIKKHFGVEE
jgi:hypothetical protein